MDILEGHRKFGQHQLWPNLVWPNLVLAKLGLAKFGFGQTWSWPNLVSPNLDLEKLGHSRLNTKPCWTGSRVKDLQCAWLLWLHCASARANYQLRVVNHTSTAQFAQVHDVHHVAD